MKKVLILAYDFPPYVSVGGLRPTAWYKYLHEFGVEPIAVTRQWSNEHGNYLDYISASKTEQTIVEASELGSIIRTPYTPNLANRLMLKYGESKYRFLRRTISAFYELAQWLWDTGPKSQIYLAAKEYLKDNKVDVIIATGDPFILFKYASKLSKEFNTPWIADYRDPWSSDISKNRNFIVKGWNVYLERKIVKSAHVICTVSEFVQSNIASLVKGKEFRIIPNGYDPEAIEKIKQIKQNTEVLNISFVGTIYPWHPLQSFLSVISDFFSKNTDGKLNVNFYGVNNAEEIQELVSKHYPNILKHISVYPKMQNDLLLQKLAEDNIMLLFNYYSYMGTKIFDYIGIKRTILLCYANDDEARKLKEKYYTVAEDKGLSHQLQEDLINETNSGYIVQNSAHLRILLDQLYQEFLKNGFIRCNTNCVELYSRKKQTEKLAELINQMI